MILKFIQKILEGYSEGIYNNKKYVVLKEAFNNGKSLKVYGKALQGANFISLNYYITSNKPSLF